MYFGFYCYLLLFRYILLAVSYLASLVFATNLETPDFLSFFNAAIHSVCHVSRRVGVSFNVNVNVNVVRITTSTTHREMIDPSNPTISNHRITINHNESSTCI